MELSSEERARYEWQLWSPELGEEGQRRLREASVLVSRIGGVGGAAAQYLAAAGVGRLILAHAGDVRPSDLNRQILMTSDWVGKPRIASARRRLLELNPHVEIITVAENLNSNNAEQLVSQADLVIDAAPLFEERYAMNAAAIRLARPIVECAMYDLTAQITTMATGRSPCLRCLHPEQPAHWKRQFPVIGAVAGVAGTIAAVEAIKVIAGVGQPLWGRLLSMNLKSMQFRQLSLERNPKCVICGPFSS